ncbi:MAG: hypothetical protein QG670_2512 [Thermoproteota archaeon]|nr:hypothetical protein [Thermoproteota archaeon]
MTCYFRHLQSIFKEAGIEVNKENRQKIDIIIHKIVGVTYPNCPATWKEVKMMITKNRDDFVSKLRDIYSTLV